MNSVFDEINKLKHSVVDKILSNQKILKLLYYSSPNPLNEPDIDNPQELVNQCIYFTPRAYNTQWRTQSVLTMQMLIHKISNSADYCDIKLSFVVAVHKDAVTINDYDDRVIEICKELYGMFNDTKTCGIGKMKLGVMAEINSAADYNSIEAIFEVSSFR